MRKNGTNTGRTRPDTKKRVAIIAAASVLGIFLIGGTLTSTLSLSALMKAMMLQTAYADPVTVGSGQGSILYRAHRMQDPRWDACFAAKCDAGSGPGVTMYFIVYDSSFVMVGHGQSDETGILIQGLTIGSTYYLSPENCNNCHGGTHNVEFDHWADGNTQRQRPYTVASGTTINADACYAFVKDGVRSTGSCMGSSPPPTNPPTNPPSQVTQTRRTFFGLNNYEIGPMVARAKAIAQINSTATASTGNETGTANITEIPSTNLSDIPLGVNAVKVHYNSLYDLTQFDSQGFARAMALADLAGIDWNKLSEDQRAYFYLVLTYGPPAGTTISSLNPANIPDTSLSGVPLGPNDVLIRYNSLYDVVSNDPEGAAQEMAIVEAQGIDWNSLSEKQQIYLILTNEFGEPQR